MAEDTPLRALAGEWQHGYTRHMCSCKPSWRRLFATLSQGPSSPHSGLYPRQSCQAQVEIGVETGTPLAAEDLEAALVLVEEQAWALMQEEVQGFEGLGLTLHPQPRTGDETAVHAS